jgi:hypothetical protein
MPRGPGSGLSPMRQRKSLRASVPRGVPRYAAIAPTRAAVHARSREAGGVRRRLPCCTRGNAVAKMKYDLVHLCMKAGRSICC